MAMTMFDVVFEKLDARTGGHNYVTLAALRAELSHLSRAQQDSLINSQRAAGFYTLDSMDGRQRRSSQEERDACLVEGTSRLGYIAKIQRY